MNGIAESRTRGAGVYRRTPGLFDYRIRIARHGLGLRGAAENQLAEYGIIVPKVLHRIRLVRVMSRSLVGDRQNRAFPMRLGLRAKTQSSLFGCRQQP